VGSSRLDRPVSIALVEDQDVVVEGVRSWIAADPEQRVVIVAVGGSIETARKGPGRDADVVVLDLELGTQESGSEMMAHRVAELAAMGCRVVVFSVHVEPLVVQAVVKAGACAFLDKRTERDHFVDTIVAVAHDQPVVTPSTAGGMLHGVQLSKREQEALQHLFQGMSYASIARRLTKVNGQPVSAVTVKDYIRRARAKFAAAHVPCKSNYALLARCIELGLIRPREIEDYRPGLPLRRALRTEGMP
jgi:two-component system, NarL family, nitrate/nitrite response regulator NarL